jgi:hypothetical protein
MVQNPQKGGKKINITTDIFTANSVKRGPREAYVKSELLYKNVTCVERGKYRQCGLVILRFKTV